MSTTATLLVEIGCEELPPKALEGLADAFAANFARELNDAELAFDEIVPYATPRRLALKAMGLAAEQPDRSENRRGPAVKVAFDENAAPTKAALGFARACGVDVAELDRIKSGDDEWLAFELHTPGRTASEIVPQLVESALARLPIAKRMRWGDRSEEFVRPVHWVVMLLNSAVVEGQLLGIESSRFTRGHRFHHPEPLELARADDYQTALARAHVVCSFADRRERIRAQVESCAAADGHAVIDKDLLDEVTALVEWPVAISGSFDENFLRLPREALIASMQDHQKYFPVEGVDGDLINKFVTVANIDTNDPATVRAGNERVVRPRLSDAAFFWNADRAERLETRINALDGMLFEKRLGTLLAKTQRVQRLAEHLSETFGADTDACARAALLARCDLVTQMVGEFPELQGIMGAYYASADGEDDPVAAAIGEFYRPRYAGDDIPASSIGRCIAVADKIDSLIGIFGIGSAPTGDRDPFALRRAAIGVVRIVIEGAVDLDLLQTLDYAFTAYGDGALDTNPVNDVYAFMQERMRGYYLDRDITADVCDAVFALNPTQPLEVDRRIKAVTGFRTLDAAAALAAANKRIANILKQDVGGGDIDPQLLIEPAEKNLVAAMDALTENAEAMFNSKRYEQYMALLSGLRGPVDAFFDAVMVMSDDEALRGNRIALLAKLHRLFTRVADIALLQGN